ncbi:MAG: hypothetical protein U0792_20180 [Gemmataceae bacterium]
MPWYSPAMMYDLPVFMSVRVTRRPPKSAPSAASRLPSASNFSPFDIPLGERKIVVFFVVGSNFQMCPAWIGSLFSREMCENVMSLK